MSTKAAIRVVILPSSMADKAFLKPARTASARVFSLDRSSSRKRSNMTTLASTAMPMPSSMPARPGRVSWILNAPSSSITTQMYQMSAMSAIRPGSR